MNDNNINNIIYNYDGTKLNIRNTLGQKVKYLLREILQKWPIYSSIVVVLLSLLALVRKVLIFKYYNISLDFLSYSVQDIVGIVIANIMLCFFVFICPIGLRYIKLGKLEKVISRILMYILCTSYSILIYADKIAIRLFHDGKYQKLCFYCVSVIIIIGLYLMYFYKIKKVAISKSKKCGKF